ncbi:D-amino acid dehydrogenase large subunit [Gracilibacillus boraciitolerans JCM 21714]|uniref:D-amino acid dehydrogenase large subunit n=1 Tax=Gracilibacillus boraciitolerans JCM 21714 TaxID=1298598 RepID=W4VNZ9_9BACI|nr:VWA domain-containing protein [Gracilibacillus boraciitolerans]GAE94464.1 D-amino acid dehydrogenase large subunit [Gracilibacillus boraciitolerans JCM 21714]
MRFLEDIPEVPTDAAGFIDQKPGKYGEKSLTDKEVRDALIDDLSKLEPLTDQATDEEIEAYFKYAYSLVVKDFPDPENLVKEWEFQSFGNPDLPDSRYHFKENYNIEVILDASGSMAALHDDKTLMETAKESILDFMAQVPEEANVSLRVYGHVGSSADSDKEASCKAIEQVYDYATYDEEIFREEMDLIQPAGWTPLAGALEEAKDALSSFNGSNHTNLIYLVSDGIETCDGNPVEVAESLANSDAQPIINIIGFHVDADAQQQLQQMAEVSGGIFATAYNQQELSEEFKRAEQTLAAWERWKENALSSLDIKELNQGGDIIQFTGDWTSARLQTYDKLTSAIYDMETNDIVTNDIADELDEQREELQELLEQIEQELVNDLEGKNVEHIEELRETIRNKYNSQVEN